MGNFPSHVADTSLQLLLRQSRQALVTSHPSEPVAGTHDARKAFSLTLSMQAVKWELSI